MVNINKQDFRINSKVVQYLLYEWEENWRGEKGKCERRRQVVCIFATVLIVFVVGLRGEEIFPTSLDGMLSFLGRNEAYKESETCDVHLKRNIQGRDGGVLAHLYLSGHDRQRN